MCINETIPAVFHTLILLLGLQYGGILAYEVLRRLQCDKYLASHLDIRHLVVSGCKDPVAVSSTNSAVLNSLISKKDSIHTKPIHTMSTSEIIEYFTHLGYFASSASCHYDKEVALLSKRISIVRQDYESFERYQYNNITNAYPSGNCTALPSLSLSLSLSLSPSSHAPYLTMTSSSDLLLSLR